MFKKSAFFSKPSKKFNKVFSKEQLQKFNNFKVPLIIFINPMPSHRIYRDYIIPHSDCNEDHPIYLFKELMSYKFLSQILVRENGIIFQMTDKSIDFITPLGLLQAELNSLGNRSAHELAQVLPKYYAKFEENEKVDVKLEEKTMDNRDFFQVSKPKVKLQCDDQNFCLFDGQILNFIDSLFEESQGLVQFITVSKIIKGMDERLIMICGSNELSRLINSDENINGKVFEAEWIDQYLEIFFCFNYECYIKEIINEIKKEPSTVKCNQNTTCLKEVNTIFGRIHADFSIKHINIQHNGVKFEISNFTLLNNRFNSALMKKIDDEKIYYNEKAKESSPIRRKCNDWEKLLKFYYPKIL